MLRKILLLICILTSLWQAEGSTTAKNEVNLVFCIDMSGSTNGIISDFKYKIWDVINGVYKLRPYPKLKIGIIGFSRPSFGKNEGYVKVLCDLTENYDQFFYELDKLKPAIEKGDQFVGAALQTAYRLNWTNDPKALRIIYLMGNGMVSSGGYDYRKTCTDILRKNIFVNTIYCIQQKIITKEIPGWKYISDNTGGEFFTYKISAVTPLKRVSADAQVLLNLNNKLNKTYIYYGISGKTNMTSMTEADKNCLNMGEVYFYSRMQYKSSQHYQANQAGWDLVNYIKAEGPKFEKIDTALLPDSLRNMDAELLKKLVLAKKDERNIILGEIRSYMSTFGLDTIQPDKSQLQGIILESINKLAKDKGVFALN